MPEGGEPRCPAQNVAHFDPVPAAAASVLLLEEAFQRGDHYFRELLDALPVALYVTDAAGRIIFFNEACIEFAGRTPVLGSDYWCVTWRLLNPDGTPLPHDRCPMAIALKEDRAVRGAEAIAERPDGTRVPFIPYPTPLHDAAGRLVGAVNMLVDITERKKAEESLRQLNEMLEQRIEARTRQMTEAYERLRQSERRFRLLVGSVVDYAIFMLDENGFVANWNAGAERIKGYSSDEIVGQHFSIFYTQEDRAAGVPERVLKAARRDGRYEAESWRVRKGGERFWANVVIDAVRDDRGEIVGYAKVTRDFTERRKTEQALVESERMARGIINTALDAFVQWDQDGIVLEWNPQAEAIFGWDARGSDRQADRRAADPGRRARRLPGRVRSLRGRRRDDFARPSPADGSDQARRRAHHGRARRDRAAARRRLRLQRLHPRSHRQDRRRSGAASGAEDGSGRPAHRRHRA